MNDFSNIQLAEQPEGFKVHLFPHQLASIYSMEHLEQNNIIKKDDDSFRETKIGIFGDKTGFGKTMAMLGVIARDKMEWNLDEPFIFETICTEAKGRIRHIRKSRFEKLSATLILVSQSIIGQWVSELKKTNLKYVTVVCNKDVDKLNLEDIDIVLVSPTFYNKVAINYNGYAWRRFCFDEPGHLRIAGMKEIHAGFYWFITATPGAIYGQHRCCKGFMRDLFGSIYYNFEEYVKDLTIKNDPAFVEASYVMPPTHHHRHRCFQPLSGAIGGFVNSTVRTMLEAGDIEGAIAALGGDKTSNIFELLKNRQLADLEMINTKIRIYTMSPNELLLQEWIERKKRAENRLKEIEESFQNILTQDCSICCDTLSRPVLERNCQNVFCGECILKWIQTKNNCPMCRATIDRTSLTYIQNCPTDRPLPDVKDVEEKLTKPETVLKIIKSKPNGKFLVFSEYDNTFFPMVAAMRENGIAFVEIKGNIKTREKNLELFRAGRIPVIFLNSNYNGAGINLTEATDIILCHQMSDTTTQQIVGRANRISRQIELHVHHLDIIQ